MANVLTNAAFLTQEVWDEAVRRCVGKKVHNGALQRICNPAWRAECYDEIINGTKEINPARTLYINKRTGDFCCKYDVLDKDRREVMMNDIMCREYVKGPYEDNPMYMYAGTDSDGEKMYFHIHGDRILLMVAYIILCNATKDMVHPRCKSYQQGISCGKTVAEVVRLMKPYIKRMVKGMPIGIKIDLSKYFDRVPRKFIHRAFNEVEIRYGKDAMVTMLRKYYNLDKYYDSGDKVWVTGDKAYKSLKQGCPVAAWLANVVLYHIDERISKMDVFYVRYSDDILIVGPEWKKAYKVLEQELAKMDMELNPDKLEILYPDKRFVFLGFSIKGDSISMSGKWINHFKKEIRLRTWDMRYRKNNMHICPPKLKDPDDPKEIEKLMQWRVKQTQKAIAKVKDFLYKGDGEHSWATQVLPYINDEHDIKLMSEYVLDSVNAVYTGECDLGTLRYEFRSRRGALVRDEGKSVLWNRKFTGFWYDGLLSVSAARKAMCEMCKTLYDVLSREAVYGTPLFPEPGGVASVADVEAAYMAYKRSVPDGSRWGSAFTADSVADLTREEVISGMGRYSAYHELLQAISNARDSIPYGSGWYWQSKVCPNLVVLKRWMH